ncbi:MAG: glucose-1-phosphate adenylyltransferase [Alphaproteobacteria bacterium]
MAETIQEEHARLQLPRRAYTLVLAGGRGSRLFELTDNRAKPAVYFGGKFRIVDFVLSNCINSGLRRMGVLTQYKSHSLLRHLQRGWSFLRVEANEFMDLLPAQQRLDEVSWYSGTADAVYQNLDIIRAHGPEFVVVLAGDHIYKMDYSRMLAFHVESKAACTVGCIEVPIEEAQGFGVMDVDASLRITDFVEKSATPPSMPGRPDRALASMGIYIFNAAYLYDMLARDAVQPGSSHDFGKDLIPQVVAQGEAIAHPFNLSCVEDGKGESYWRDVGTLDAYWAANIDLCAVTPHLDMYAADWPIITHQEQLPPAKFVFDDDERRGTALDSLVSGGCIISGSTVRRSLLFSRCRVDSWATLEGAVILPEVRVNRYARLSNVIVDRGCNIPRGLVVGEDPEEDARRFRRTDRGVTLITRAMLDRLG